MIEISKCRSYINDFKLYSKWTGEINKAIAYRKLKNRPPMMWLYKRPFLAQDMLPMPLQSTGAMVLPIDFICRLISRAVCATYSGLTTCLPLGVRWLYWDWEWNLGRDTGVHIWEGTWAGWIRSSVFRRLWGWNKEPQTVIWSITP